MTKPVNAIPHSLLIVSCLLAALFSLWWPRAVVASPPVAGARALGAWPGDGGPSRVIFPPQTVPLRFSHRKHVGDLAMNCTECHAAAKSSTRGSDLLLPGGATCDRCHDSDHSKGPGASAPASATGQCALCHVGYEKGEPEPIVPPVVMPAPNLKFSHAAHASRNISCEQCHGDVSRVDLATRDQLPRMRGCLQCHRGTGATDGKAKLPSGRCSTCHVTEGGRLKTDFATGPLLPPKWLRNAEHGPDWIERHKRVAGQDSRFCSTCHEESDCAECHDGTVRPRSIHPNDFLSMHAVAARQDGASCTSCHREQSFCLSCHQRSGVAQSGPFANFATRGRFHPPKTLWTDGPRSARHHAWEAQKNLNTCTSCHAERDCATCHATRHVGARGSDLPAGPGRGTNPHPPGFRARCGRPFRENPRSCLFCHGADPVLRSCR